MVLHRYYLHGDMYDLDNCLYYCGQCDLFVSRDHFNTFDHKDQNKTRLFRSIKKLLASERAIRPDNAPNLAAEWLEDGENELRRLLFRQTERTTIPPSLRFRILRRDKYFCQMCGATAKEGAKLQIDHKIPLAKGGANDISNLWTLCFVCNIGKSADDL